MQRVNATIIEAGTFTDYTLMKTGKNIPRIYLPHVIFIDMNRNIFEKSKYYNNCDFGKSYYNLKTK